MIELACHDGYFGRIEILERQRDGARLYRVGDGIQTMARPDGESLFGYVHALKKLCYESQTVLLIGGAGGSLATMLARRGRTVVVVDIDPVARLLAERYFGLDLRVEWITADGLALTGRWHRRFDAVIVDACDAHGTVKAFLDVTWLAETMNSVQPGGQLLLNLANSGDAWDPGSRIARGIATKGFRSTFYFPEDGCEGNELVRISREPHPNRLDLKDVPHRPQETHTYLMSLRSYDATPSQLRVL